jgi:CheY-like chemotaxis protein
VSAFRCATILSIRDNPPDERLIEEVWGSHSEVALIHVDCGLAALEYMRKPGRKLPNLILLAWRFRENHMSALETVAALKADDAFRAVPVIVLAGKLSPSQIQALYAQQVSCVFEMPGTVDELERILLTLKDLWLNSARLPYAAEAYE